MIQKINHALLEMSKTKWNYYLSFIFDSTLVFIFIMTAIIQENPVKPYEYITLTVSGLLTFTLIEYLVHFKLFHGNIKSFKIAHAKHHRNPLGYDALPFFTAIFIISPISLTAFCCMNSSEVLIYTSSILIGYISYGIMHHLMHRLHPKSGYMKYMIEFHDLHHEDPTKNHGVTTPIWDHIFGTSIFKKN